MSTLRYSFHYPAPIHNRERFPRVKTLDERIAKTYPRLATSVAVFVFHLDDNDIIVSVGDVETYLWDGHKWYKPKEINDHWLDSKIYDSNVARFFGASEHKRDPRFPGVFSAEPDVLSCPSLAPIMIATDGIKDVLSLNDINTLAINPKKASPKKIVETILHEIARRGSQRDDISLLVRSCKLCELIEDRSDERDAAELSREDRGIGIPLSTIAKKRKGQQAVHAITALQKNFLVNLKDWITAHSLKMDEGSRLYFPFFI